MSSNIHPISPDIVSAISALNKGKVIAYPTEAVYGLGCDPLNQAAVTHLLALKNRPQSKGLILIAASWDQLAPYVDPIPPQAMARVFATWPGPVTWVFPAAARVPQWICGAHTTLAIRVTAHPIARELCIQFGRPLVSTSANVTGQVPLRSSDEVSKIFIPGVDVEVIVRGEIGNLLKPTEIRSAVTGEVIRV